MFHLFIEWVHIVGAAILIGTGSGTAFQMFMAHRGNNVQAITVVAKNTVLSEWLFTLTAGVILPVSGAILIHQAGWNPLAPWLVWAYVFYLLAFACWLPLMWLQIQMRDIAQQALRDGGALPERYHRYMRRWFLLGWPAFAALMVVVWLMVAKGATT